MIIALGQIPPINSHIDVTSNAQDLNFGHSLHLHPYSVIASSEGSGESPESSLHKNVVSKSHAGPFDHYVWMPRLIQGIR